MDAFFCITLSILLLRWWWKNQDHTPKPPKIPDFPPSDTIEPLTEADKQRNRDIAELKKQGYTDDLIAVILPQLNNK